MSEPIYGRVDDAGNVVEYPVYLVHIQNRAEPIEMYKEVVLGVMPTIPDFYNLTENVYYSDGKIRTSYSVEPASLPQLIKQANSVLNTDPSEPVVDVFYADVDPALAARITRLSTEYAQGKLIAFCNTRFYDTDISAISYKDSTVPQYAADALVVLAARDALWVAMNTYFNNVVAGTIPILKSVDDLDAIIPVMSWS